MQDVVSKAGLEHRHTDLTRVLVARQGVQDEAGDGLGVREGAGPPG